MRRDEAFTELPGVYRCALGLLAKGRSLDEVAGLLGVEPHAVPSLVELAEAKLARLMAADHDS